MRPIVNGLEAEFQDQIEVIWLDASVPANVELQQSYGLRGHPAFAVLDREGMVAEIFFGPQSETDLRAALTAVLE